MLVKYSAFDIIKLMWKLTTEYEMLAWNLRNNIDTVLFMVV